MYRLEFATTYAQSWRYNIIITCAMLDDSGEQCGYISAEDSPLPVGSNAEEAPEGFNRHRAVSVEVGSCHKVRFYIYVLPNSLPEKSELVGEKMTFPAQVKIYRGQEVIFDQRWEINRYGGCGTERVVELQ